LSRIKLHKQLTKRDLKSRLWTNFNNCTKELL